VSKQRHCINLFVGNNKCNTAASGHATNDA